MEHKGTVTIETERLILRRFKESDAPSMFKNWASDPLVTKYLTWPTYTDPKAADRIIGVWMKEYSFPAYYQWAIELKSIGEAIGSISSVDIKERAGAVTLGYCIGHEFWHMGIMTEAVNAVIAFFFEEVKARSINACHDPRNPHSGMVMRKCGMRYDGTLRGTGQNNLGVTDEAWHSILRGEYYKKKLGYEIIRISENPKLIESAARWFNGKWGAPLEAYLESMESSLTSKTYPEWYLAVLNGEFIGGLGVIENDFHDRKDLFPNVCAVYTEPEFRAMGVAGELLLYVCEDMRSRGVSPLYLVTDHDSFYERYGWDFLTNAQGDFDEEPSRLYVHL